MKTELIVVLGLLILSPSFAVTAQDRLPEPAMKGMELYSWRPDGKGWHFSILGGTNRNKTEDEIKEPEQTTIGVDALKKRLAGLVEGERIHWINLANETVPEEMRKELKEFCAGIKVELN